MSTKTIRLDEVAPAVPVPPVDIINIEYNKKKLDKSPYSNKLLSICNEISKLLYKKDFSTSCMSYHILNKTIESHKNIKLEYIKNMVTHANNHNILMKIEYLV
jgi:hypothetical protein